MQKLSSHLLELIFIKHRLIEPNLPYEPNKKPAVKVVNLYKPKQFSARDLYKLTENDSTYYIPLWHHELIYDNAGNDLYIKCIPILPDNVTIDTYNNIHLYITYNLRDIWGKTTIEFEMGKKKFSFFTEDLKLKENQQLILPKEGISIMNIDNIYDISKRADVYLHFTLFLEN